MAKTNLLDSKAGGLMEHAHNHDGINRRGFLKCMAWAGTGAFCVIEGGVLLFQATEFRIDEIIRGRGE